MESSAPQACLSEGESNLLRRLASPLHHTELLLSQFKQQRVNALPLTRLKVKRAQLKLEQYGKLTGSSIDVGDAEVAAIIVDEQPTSNSLNRPDLLNRLPCSQQDIKTPIEVGEGFPKKSQRQFHGDG